MIDISPNIEERAPLPVDTAFPALFGWLGEHGPVDEPDFTKWETELAYLIV